MLGPERFYCQNPPCPASLEEEVAEVEVVLGTLHTGNHTERGQPNVGVALSCLKLGLLQAESCFLLLAKPFGELVLGNRNILLIF